MIEYGMKKIVIYPNEVLRKRAVKVEKIDKNLFQDIKDLEKVLEKSENGAALAANQIGVAKRFIGIKNLKEKKIDVLINPEIKKFYGEKVYPKMVGEGDKSEDFLEGCLSFPDFYGTVKRYLKIEVAWQDLNGDKKEKFLEGFEAIVFQHEFDHLNGVLFVDHIKEEGGKFYKWNGKEMVKEKLSYLSNLPIFSK